MSLAGALSTYHAPLGRPDDFACWRDHARRFLAAEIAPERIVWETADGAVRDLFAENNANLHPGAGPNFRVSRDLLVLLRLALMHRAPSRFAVAYRIMWRLLFEPSLSRDPADPDMIALQGLARAVRRDIHKMHAFVRFRQVGGEDGRERFAAWFEPDHHIVRATAGFFRDRFAGIDWVIITPEISVGWDGERLREGPGGTRSDVPASDAREAEWRAYYASIFNPARLKVNAMKREMPVRYWRNLPEADLIADLVQGAEKRVEAMVAEQGLPPLPDMDAPAMAFAGQEFDTLDELYTALRRTDTPPSTSFSDHVVLGEGPLDAALMLVGEQPGDQEDLLGRPFVGPAGQLLDRCLKDIGIIRRDVFLTNAVKRFKFTRHGKRRLHQTPSAAEITHYRWWLAEEIRLVKPRIVVTLGATALHALSGRKQPLGQVRGVVLPWADRFLFPTIHPSFLLRASDEQARRIEHAKFVRDLRAAASASCSR